MNNNKKMVTLKDIINSGMIENGTDILVSEQYKNGATAVTTNIISDYLNHEVINISPFSPNAVCVNVKSKKDNDFIPDLTESKNMTIGDLKEAIKYLPDNMKVFIPLYEGTEENIIPVDHCYANIAGIIDDKLYGKGFTFGTLSDASNLTMERIYQATKGTVCVEQLFPELNKSEDLDKGLDKSETNKQKPEKTNKPQTINAESDVPEIIAGTPIITNIIGKSVEEAIERIHLTNEKQKIESFEIKLILKRKYNEVDLVSYILAYSKINIENKVISERLKDLVVDNVSITQKFLGTSYEHTIYRIYINIDESKNTDVVNKNIDVIDQIIRSLTPTQQYPFYPKQQHHFYEDCPNGDAPNKNNIICKNCDDKNKCDK